MDACNMMRGMMSTRRNSETIATRKGLLLFPLELLLAGKECG
jgi:hypothetical protein